MKKYTWLLLLLVILIWLIIVKEFTGTESIQKNFDFPAVTPTPQTPEAVIGLTESATSSATPSAFFEASSSSILLTAPTITVDYRY